MAFCHRTLGDPWPATDDGSLIDAADRWLEPELSRARRRSDLERLDVSTALHRLVPWSVRLADTAPERIEVPSGSRIRIDYSGDQPVLAAKLQELFGWQRPLAIAGVPLVIHLLSPRGPSGRRHRRPGLLLARGLPRGPRRTPRPLSPASLAGGSPVRRRHPPHQPPPLTPRHPGLLSWDSSEPSPGSGGMSDCALS